MTEAKTTAWTLTSSPTRLRASLPRSTAPAGSLAYVFLGGRRVWTFRVEAGHWDSVTGNFEIGWPAAVVPHLSGVSAARLEIRAEPDMPASHIAEGNFDFGGGTQELQLLDPLTGAELVVNKWGRLAKSFEAADEALQQEVLQSADSLMSIVKGSLGLDLFVTGGTLLGLVRDGKLICSDDDADLAYVSKHGNPSDIVLESYKVERLLAENGLETVRHSSGHLQVMFGETAYSDAYYVDIFTYFVTDGWFHGTFHARERAEDVTILPLGTVVYNGLELPIPANTDQMLAAIYGPGWKTPDPAFKFVTPESAGRRFYWWLNHYDQFREDWEDFHRGQVAEGITPAPSALSRWLTAELESDSAVLELGCGLGVDAVALAVAGHRVLAVDYSRPAVAHGAALADVHRDADGHSLKLNVRFEVANANSIRDMAVALKGAAELAGPGVPVSVMSRNLFDNLHFLGRDNALELISHLLNRGGNAYLQMRNPKIRGGAKDSHEPVGESIFDPWEFTGRLAHYGLEIVKTNFFVEPDSAGSSLSFILGKVTSK